MRASFSSIKRDDPDVFVVKVEGHLGLKERGRVEELLRKCDEKQKHKVIFEFSAIESLGGSIAALLGEFVAERESQGFAPGFVGCSDTVQNFLIGRFDGEKPRFFGSIEEAEDGFAKAGSGASAPVEPEEEKAPKSSDSEKPREPLESPEFQDAPESSGTPRGGLDLMLDAAEMDGGTASHDEATPPPPIPDPSTKLRIVEVDTPVPSARYLSLSEAEKAFAAARDLAGMKGAVGALLHGVDLAEACHLMTRVGKKLEEIGDEKRTLPLDGLVAERLLKANTPVPMEDLGGDDLSSAETELLTAFNCQMAVPIIVKGELTGALFLHKDQTGKDYGASEVLALDLLGRKLAYALSKDGEGLSSEPPSSKDPKKEPESNEQLTRKIHQQRALFKIGKEFNSTLDEDHLISLVLLTTIAQVGVGSVAWFELENGKLVPRKQRGMDEVELEEIVVEAPEHLRQLGAAAGLKAKAPVDELQGIFDRMAEFGFEYVAPLRGKAKMFGILAMGPRLSGGTEERIDDEFLIILLNQAGVALENAILIRDLHDRTLGVAQTFVNLIEKRGGPGARASTELISHYVGKVAKAINFPTDQVRDLVYGTVLRDIGMIEISDLVLRSPRSLSQEEWQLIKQHPLTGVEILSGMDFSSTIKDVVLYHHERFNGEGYPHGLRGPAIPLGARVVSVVESFVAMTRDLPYRAALSRIEATEVIKENWGMRYDPEVLQAFLEIVEAEGEHEPVDSDLVVVS